tara:strand:- start:1497 stop:2246 length:750 start_codon:yes stop_codon:yes gene_type:complete
MINLKTQLLKLKPLGVVGIKQSTEDEGALQEDISLMRDITRSCDLKLSVKIGGCEANTDISFCNNIEVNGMVAPMVESEFALQKFTESVANVRNKNFYINIESSNAITNLDSILNSASFKLLEGVVIGRSDLAKSYGYGKGMVDSKEMQSLVYKTLKTCKNHKTTTLMGGNISCDSISFIQKLYSENLLDFIETRNVIIELNKYNINNLYDVICDAIKFEAAWLEFKASKYLDYGNQYKERASAIKRRL